MKQCSKCKEWKEATSEYFSKDKLNKDGLCGRCKKCKKEYQREWYENNKEYHSMKNREWHENNKEYHSMKNREWNKNNKEYLSIKKREYRQNNKEYLSDKDKERNNSSLNYNSETREKLEQYEQIRKSINGNIEVLCTYCGEYFEPSRKEIQRRLDAINGLTQGESRLYCSNKCKENCPIYGQIVHEKGYKPASSREVQPQLRQLVFQRDSYTCQRCNTYKDDLNTGIQCHHMEGVKQNPIESADKDICITLCEDCHNEVHNQDGCKYHELKCA